MKVGAVLLTAPYFTNNTWASHSLRMWVGNKESPGRVTNAVPRL
jgi:hypothetical protein